MIVNFVDRVCIVIATHSISMLSFCLLCLDLPSIVTRKCWLSLITSDYSKNLFTNELKKERKKRKKTNEAQDQNIIRINYCHRNSSKMLVMLWAGSKSMHTIRKLFTVVIIFLCLMFKIVAALSFVIANECTQQNIAWRISRLFKWIIRNVHLTIVLPLISIFICHSLKFIPLKPIAGMKWIANEGRWKK